MKYIRIAVVEVKTGLVNRVYTPTTIPDFTTKPLGTNLLVVIPVTEVADNTTIHETWHWSDGKWETHAVSPGDWHTWDIPSKSFVPDNGKAQEYFINKINTLTNTKVNMKYPLWELTDLNNIQSILQARLAVINSLAAITTPSAMRLAVYNYSKLLIKL